MTPSEAASPNGNGSAPAAGTPGDVSTRTGRGRRRGVRRRGRGVDPLRRGPAGGPRRDRARRAAHPRPRAERAGVDPRPPRAASGPDRAASVQRARAAASSSSRLPTINLVVRHSPDPARPARAPGRGRSIAAAVRGPARERAPALHRRPVPHGRRSTSARGWWPSSCRGRTTTARRCALAVRQRGGLGLRAGRRRRALPDDARSRWRGGPAPTAQASGGHARRASWPPPSARLRSRASLSRAPAAGGRVATSPRRPR